METSQRQRYRYLAAMVIRDALGFYFGIPKFLDEENLNTVRSKVLAEKINLTKKLKNRELTPKEISRCTRVTERSINCRIKELQEDFTYCKEVLFTDNLWLQLLDLKPDFFKLYLPSLNLQNRESLAVVPKWGIKDHSLGRSYINDNFAHRDSFV